MIQQNNDKIEELTQDIEYTRNPRGFKGKRGGGGGWPIFSLYPNSKLNLTALMTQKQTSEEYVDNWHD